MRMRQQKKNVPDENKGTVGALESRTLCPLSFFLLPILAGCLDVVSCSIAPATRLQPTAKSASGKAQADKQAH